ncbi:hypothetical protein GYB22_05900 [bacterium]|nr:hypothetical protein [bacterium]
MTKKTHNVLAAIIAVLLLIDANLYLNHFGFKVTDSDQTIFWNQSEDISRGEIKSMFLYGQDYNIPVESFLAAPLLRLGISANKALPIAGMIMMLLSFVLLYFRFAQNQQYLIGLIALATPLLLPSEWQVMSTIPRGFYGAIFLASIALSAYRDSTISRLLSFLFAALALAINPNAVIVLLPFYLIVFFEKDWNKKNLIHGIIVLIGVFTLKYLLSNFCEASIIHKSWTIEWSWAYFTSFLQNFNTHFKGTAPIFYHAGALSFVILVLILIAAVLKKNKIALYSSALFLAFIVFSFGINKVNDGTGSVFFPYARMFMGLPIAIILLASTLFESKTFSLKAVSICMILILVSGVLKVSFAFPRYSRIIKESSGVVQVYHTDNLESICSEIRSILLRKNLYGVVFYTKEDALNYGCEVLNDIETIHPNYERRAWQWEKFNAQPARNLLFIDWSGELVEKYPALSWKVIPNTEIPAYLIQDEMRFKDLKSIFVE